MGIIKRKNSFAKDDNAFVITGTFLIGALITALVGSAVVVGVYNATQTPDITYNISDTGFSLAGLGIDSTTLLMIGAGVVVLFLFLGMRKKS